MGSQERKCGGGMFFENRKMVADLILHGSVQKRGGMVF